MPYSARRRRFYQRFAKVHGALLLKTKGRPHRLGRNQFALVLETVGRRSGELRQLPLLYMPYDNSFLIIASNYGQERPPAWWFNLQAAPEAHVLWSGQRLAVRWRLLDGQEREDVIPQCRAYNPQWNEYFTSVERELPIVVLERVGDA